MGADSDCPATISWASLLLHLYDAEEGGKREVGFKRLNCCSRSRILMRISGGQVFLYSSVSFILAVS